MQQTTAELSVFTAFNTAVTGDRADIPVVALLFIILYLLTMWTINWRLLSALRSLPPHDRKGPRHFAVANILLASGDTAMFLCFLLLALLKLPMGLPAPPGTLPLEVAGFLTTSLTMSCYYLFLAFYCTVRFPSSRHPFPLIAVLVLFSLRIMLHYSPTNVWVRAALPPHTPNYSAWIRNAPLFVYGLWTVGILLLRARNAAREADATGRPGGRESGLVAASMACLIASFLFYSVDVFFSHVVPSAAIWATYSLKTVAYVIAALLLYRAEFSQAGGLALKSRLQ